MSKVILDKDRALQLHYKQMECSYKYLEYTPNASSLYKESFDNKSKISFWDESISTAEKTYRLFHGCEVPHYTEAMTFLKRLDFLFSNRKQEIILKSYSLKVIIKINDKKIIIDYDYGYENSILVTEKKDSGYHVKECSIDNLTEVMKASVYKLE